MCLAGGSEISASGCQGMFHTGGSVFLLNVRNTDDVQT
jgi:hypothetical protein